MFKCGGRGERFRYYPKKFPTLSFPFFYYHKIFEQLFFLCFLKYDSFSNCQQSHYRNIGYFEGIYKCENLTFHLQTEKDVKFVSEMVLTQCIHFLKIAIIIYRCIKKIQLVWCWPTKLSIICNSGIILKLDKRKKLNKRWFIFMFCSEYECYELLKKNTKFNKI